MDEIYIEHSNGISKSTCYRTLNFLCGSNVEIPDIQRIANPHHVDVISQAYKSQYTKEKNLLIIGQISLCKIVSRILDAYFIPDITDIILEFLDDKNNEEKDRKFSLKYQRHFYR